MLRNRASKLKLYVKRVLHRKGVYSSGSVISREDNISLYRSSRAARRAECPNLPLNLLVEVTSRCNLECRMCNVHHNTRSGRMIPDGLLDATLDLAKTASVVYPFGLGEPLLHPDIVGIVRRYKSLGAFVGFVTNGMLLTEKISGGLIANGLDHLTISVDAADKALLSQIRRGADLDRISANIRTLISLKKSLGSGNPSLSLSVVSQLSNFTEMKGIVRLARELGIYAVDFSPITVHEHISEIQGEALGPGVADWREILSACDLEAEARGVSIDTRRLRYVLGGSSPAEVYQEVVPCPEPFCFMVIRANGDVFPCCNWDVKRPIATVASPDKASSGDLREIWKSPDWRALRERIILGDYPEECVKCMTNYTRPYDDRPAAA